MGGGTEPAEIERQRLQAVQLVQDGIKFTNHHHYHISKNNNNSNNNDVDDNNIVVNNNNNHDDNDDKNQNVSRNQMYYDEIPLRYKTRPVYELYQEYLMEDKKRYQQQQQHQPNVDTTMDEKKENHEKDMSCIIQSNGKIDDDETWKEMKMENEENENENEIQSVQRFISTSFFPFWTSRGYVDVTELQNLVRHGYNQKYSNNDNTIPTPTTTKTQTQTQTQTTNTTTLLNHNNNEVWNYWCPNTASKYNVSIRRPSHDEWGIGKIILLFCDDFLNDIYELPYWWLDNDNHNHKNNENNSTKKNTEDDTKEKNNNNNNNHHTNTIPRQPQHHVSSFQSAIQPILDVLKIQSNRIVRLLFATLPPGVTIPIHSDSGEWVQHTHRIHCPILVQDPNSIVFQCGVTPTTMENIYCGPGHIFEINNQANHFVCNCSTDYRVHLILDYVDEDYYDTHMKQKQEQEQRIRLQPGETIVQTRRSIDRLINQGKRCTPTFFILGAQKAGTTTIYEAILQHPLVIPPKRRETHCFDWRWKQNFVNNNKNKNNNTNKKSIDADEKQKQQQQYEWILNFYHAKELHYHPSCLTGDSTPSYLIDSLRVIPRIKSTLQHYKECKFIIMVRDPIKRCESHYAMVTSTEGTPAQLQTRGYEWKQPKKTFQNVMMEDIHNMKNCGLLPYWNVSNDPSVIGNEFDPILFANFTGSVAESEAWDEYLSKHIPLNTGSYGLISRGLYELNLRPWIRSFTINQFWFIQLEHMNGVHSNVYETVQDVYQHLQLPKITSYYRNNNNNDNDNTTKQQQQQFTMNQPKNTRQYETIMDDDTKSYLQRFYQPHNEVLRQFIIQHMKKNCSHYEQWLKSGSWNY